MNSQREFISARYQHLWETARPSIHAGKIEIDSTLANEAADLRRGLTLLVWPDHVLQKRVEKVSRELRAIDPSQYYYPRESLHITVLSLFTATTEHQHFVAKQPRYQEAVRSAVAGVRQFALELKGITASTGAVMIQGFPLNDTLEELRERLRTELQRRSLNEGLDTRYRLITAHMTMMRFRSRLRESGKFAEALAELRTTDFGTLNVKEVSLVKNDWYMSPETVEPLSHYPLIGET